MKTANSPETIAAVERALDKHDTAWTTYSVQGFPTDDEVYVDTATNDNGDTGYPGEYADWSTTFRTNIHGTAYERALAYVGVSRFGIGHVVAVRVNGHLV